MRSGELPYRNIRFYARYYRLVAVAVLIAVAVLTGSLVVGDSVRTTLARRVAERLGDTETVLFSRNSFLSERLVNAPLFGGTARGILLVNGFIPQDGRLIPVWVWGVDDPAVPEGSARINAALQKESGREASGDIVLRLPASGLVPSGSLFVTENYTTSLRLTLDGIAGVNEGGNLSLKNEQAIPLNIFVNRNELAGAMEVTGKINLILTPRKIPADEWEQAWEPAASGLTASQETGFTEIRSDRVFLQEEAAAAIIRRNTEPNRLFSYLANSIEGNGAAIPYSFVTALDRYNGQALQQDEIILSDYSANRLQAKPGDRIRLTYFTSHDLKTLRSDTILLHVKEIVPLQELLADKTLSADFPGLSDVERCTDWDSDLPIDMDLITDEDERYWQLYRSTPKAILAYDAVAADWGNAYGNATAIRVADSIPDLSGLRAGMFGIQLIHPRETGLLAAKNGVDFSGLFLSLGFFIIVSAVLLMLIPLSGMLYRRKDETGLLKALGYTRRRIAGMLWRESAPVVLAASAAGVVAGLLYTTLVLWLLGTVWKGATHTDGFSVYPGATTLLGGFLGGVVLSLFVLWRTIAGSLKEKRRLPKAGGTGGSLVWPVASSLVAAAAMGINLFALQSAALFVVAGIVLIGTAAVWGNYLIVRNGSPSPGRFHTDKLMWSTLRANRRQAVFSFLALATGVFIVFSVGLNRKGFADSSQIRTGTGGYSFWCESSVPVYHNMMTEAGREKLSLTGLPAGTQVLQCLRYGADDASCLNLNKVSTPTVLGVDMDALPASSFRIEQSLDALSREEAFSQLKRKTGDAYPALIDATVLTWSLMMNLGDTLHYTNDRGEDIAIRIVGTLSNSIFQGHILIDRTLFSGIWDEITGSEVFLLKTDEEDKEEVRTLLSQALNEYGIRITSTNDRLKQFNSVTDTYLTIFLTLGGLGLLLGIMSFVVVIRKNLAMRRREIDLYRTFGFTDQRIGQLLYRENLSVPLYAIAAGLVSSLAGTSAGFMHAGAGVWLLALLFAAVFVLCVVVFVRKQVEREILMDKLI